MGTSSAEPVRAGRLQQAALNRLLPFALTLIGKLFLSLLATDYQSWATGGERVSSKLSGAAAKLAAREQIQTSELSSASDSVDLLQDFKRPATSAQIDRLAQARAPGQNA